MRFQADDNSLFFFNVQRYIFFLSQRRKWGKKSNLRVIFVQNNQIMSIYVPFAPFLYLFVPILHYEIKVFLLILQHKYNY